LFNTLLGSAAIACLQLGVYNCIVVEKEEEKRCAIRRHFVNKWGEKQGRPIVTYSFVVHFNKV